MHGMACKLCREGTVTRAIALVELPSIGQRRARKWVCWEHLQQLRREFGIRCWVIRLIHQQEEE